MTRGKLIYLQFCYPAFDITQDSVMHNSSLHNKCFLSQVWEIKIELSVCGSKMKENSKKIVTYCSNVRRKSTIPGTFKKFYCYCLEVEKSFL